jgi:hypothetical protein
MVLCIDRPPIFWLREASLFVLGQPRFRGGVQSMINHLAIR